MTSHWASEDLTRDGFLDGRLQIWQPRHGYRAGADPVFLAAAVPARAGQSVLELGTGAGTGLLCLAMRVNGLTLTGLEVQPNYADLARLNAREAGHEIQILTGDLRSPPQALRARRFDHVMMNPPYFPVHGRTRARDPGREAGRGETAPLDAWLVTGLRRLAPRGTLSVIQDARRLPEILAFLAPRTGTISVHSLAPRNGRPANRVIVQALREGAGFTLAPPVILHDGASHKRDGDSYSRPVAEVLRAGKPWPWLAD